MENNDTKKLSSKQKKAYKIWKLFYEEAQVAFDFAGREMRRDDYGNHESSFGWDLDHAVPQKLKTGIKAIMPCHILTNREKGSSYPDFEGNGKSFTLKIEYDYVTLYTNNSILIKVFSIKVDESEVVWHSSVQSAIDVQTNTSPTNEEVISLQKLLERKVCCDIKLNIIHNVTDAIELFKLQNAFIDYCTQKVDALPIYCTLSYNDNSSAHFSITLTLSNLKCENDIRVIEDLLTTLMQVFNALAKMGRSISCETEKPRLYTVSQ